MIVYRLAQLLVRSLWPLLGRVHAEGLENVPDKGPFILIANHQSYLDAIILQAVVRRPIHTMSKSTQFSDSVTGGIVRALKGFPVRRFQVDPQAVRMSLRLLEQGEGVGIYIEGERTWDGRLQPPRLGTIRLILKAGVPVVPCGISGTYAMWPRWDRRPRRGAIRIRLGEPLRFPRLDRRDQRDAMLEGARDRLMSTVAELAGVEQAPEFT
jgi:1-acyl-sn-glycerol-3-phosphate acyltransferase